MPRVTEANALSNEMKRGIAFETKITPVMTKNQGMISQVMVKVRRMGSEPELEWLWDKNKFINRVYIMREQFERFQVIHHLPPYKSWRSLSRACVHVCVRVRINTVYVYPCACVHDLPRVCFRDVVNFLSGRSILVDSDSSIPGGKPRYRAHGAQRGSILGSK